jgi:CrcB protein
MNYILVSIGAALGGVLRYWLTNVSYKVFPVTFPYGTLLVNIIGSFLLGIIMFYFDERELLNPSLRLFLTIGFCGGFTTFSTFSYETILLFRESQILFGILNILANLLLCLAGIYLAYLLSKLF